MCAIHSWNKEHENSSNFPKIANSHNQIGFVAQTCRYFSPGYETSAVKDMRTIMSSTNFP